MLCKINISVSIAAKYFMFKDHKKERKVASSCVRMYQYTLGISNLLSDVVESICSSKVDPFEVISSEDMLHQFEVFVKEVASELEENKDYDWRNNWMVMGSDVKSLFPSLTKEKTAKAVRAQAEKNDIKWTNIDSKWLRLYIH